MSTRVKNSCSTTNTHAKPLRESIDSVLYFPALQSFVIDIFELVEILLQYEETVPMRVVRPAHQATLPCTTTFMVP